MKILKINGFYSDPIISRKVGKRFKKFPFYSPGLNLLAPQCSITSYIPSSMVKSGCRFYEDAPISEDWFFWLSGISKGYQGYNLNFPIFYYYRPQSNSRSSSKTSQILREEIISKFINILRENINFKNELFKDELKSIEKLFYNLNKNEPGDKPYFDKSDINYSNFWNDDNLNFQKLFKNFILNGVTLVSDDWLLSDNAQVTKILSVLEIFSNDNPFRLVSSSINDTDSIRLIENSDIVNSAVVYAERIMPMKEKTLIFDLPNSLN